jgi:alanine racemase
MNNMSRPTRAIIDLAALRANLQRVQACASSQYIMAVVKANAYGHGAVRVAEVLESNVDAFAVRSLEEALTLRDAGISKPIVLLEGFFRPEELPLIAQGAIEIVMHTGKQLNDLINTPLEKAINVWLKVDTGMNRLGFSPNDIETIYKHLKECSQVEEIRLISHLACADDLEDAMTEVQSDTFVELATALEIESSLANSAGILGWPQTHADWVRPGIMLYGVSPFPKSVATEEGLQAVMQLESSLIGINRIKKGDTVGYGATWTSPQSMLIGVVAIGYADGYPRHAPSGTPVLVNGSRVPLIGRVSMDMITVDLRNQPNANIGDPVVLWGKDLPVEEVASLAGTIGYELLCHVNCPIESY